MSDELPTDIELPLSDWERGERDEARARWEQLRDRPGTVGSLAQRCLALADRGIDTIRDELGPLPSADEIGWEELLISAAADDDDDLELLGALSGLSGLSSEHQSRGATPSPQATTPPPPAPSPVTPSGVDAFFDKVAAPEAAAAVTPVPTGPSAIDFFFDDVLDGERVTREHDARALEDAANRFVDPGDDLDLDLDLDDDDGDERPLAARNLHILAPDDAAASAATSPDESAPPRRGMSGLDALDGDGDGDAAGNFFAAAEDTRQRATHDGPSESEELDAFFGIGRATTRVREQTVTAEHPAPERPSADHAPAERRDDDRFVSGERRAAAEALTRRDEEPHEGTRRARPLQEPSRSHTPPAPSPATDFFDDLFERLEPDEDDDAAYGASATVDATPEPVWLGGIEPVRHEAPATPPPPSNSLPDVSADLDDLREIFGATSRLVEGGELDDDDDDASGDPWAELSSELGGAAAPGSAGRLRPMPSRGGPGGHDERPRTVPRSRIPTSRPTSRYAPEPAPKPRPRADSGFPRTKTPVRPPASSPERRSPLSDCQRILDDGNPFGAYVRALEYRQDGEAGLDDFIDAVQEQLLAMAVELIKPLDRCPVLKVPPAAIPSLKNIDHRGGYLLSQIDGMITIEFLIELGAMPRADAALLLLTLAERGIIALDG